MARWIGLAIVPLLLAAALLAACSNGDDDDETTASASASTTSASASASTTSAGASASTTSAVVAAPAPAARAAASLAAAGASSGTGGAGPRVAFQQVDTGRSIVFVGTMLIEVTDVRRATQQAQVAIAGLGGLVFGQHTTSEPAPRTELTFKVMPADFAEAMGRIEALGELKSQQISADDVTERVVNLESRIITARASVERLRNFLGTATGVEAVAELESQLLARETDLELLRGQLRTIEGQVALATIFLTLVEP